MAELVGFESARIGILDDNGQVDPAKLFTINNPNGGPLGANIQNLNYTPTVVYAGDAAYKVSGKGTGAVTCALTAQDIDHDVIAQITGAQKNENGIYVLTKDTVAPDSALELVSHDSSGKKVYLALLRGKFGFPDRNPQTNNANEVDFTDALTFTALNRVSDGAVYAEAYEADNGFQESEWESFVFPPSGATTTTTAG